MLTKKAVALVSGGLDSTLAVKLVLEQGVQVVGLYLSAPWGCCDKTKAMKAAAQLGIEFMVLKMTQEYIQVIRAPKYGYGSSMNPCIDCRIYMFHKAKELMHQVGASFIVTGEVLGQRPMSQMRHSLRIIEQDAGLSRLIVRPLSAKLFAPTLPEEQGIVNREKLFKIAGRGRRPQMELAKKLGILDYPNPAGGCLLTDQQFGDRVRDLFDHQADIELEDMELLQIGRHFRINPSTKFIVGRNEEENRVLVEYLAPGRFLFVPNQFHGPSVMVAGQISDEINQMALQMIVRYTQVQKVPENATVMCRIGLSRDHVHEGVFNESFPLPSPGMEETELERMRI